MYSATQPQSVPFLLPHPAIEVGAEIEGPLYRDDEVSSEHVVPPSKSVAPHAPPARTPMPEEVDLPTIIVDLRDVMVTEEQEAQRASDIDVLLTVSDEIVTSERSIPVAKRARRTRGALAALILASLAMGATLAGLHVRGVSAHDVGAALHFIP